MTIEINGNVTGQVAERIDNHFGRIRPPKGHPNARICPQCGQSTWKMTQHCCVCGVDLFEIDEAERRDRRAWRRTKFVVSFVVLAFCSWKVTEYLPERWRIWAAVVSGVALWFAALIAKDD